jgi:hypothetical protein
MSIFRKQNKTTMTASEAKSLWGENLFFYTFYSKKDVENI